MQKDMHFVQKHTKTDKIKALLKKKQGFLNY